MQILSTIERDQRFELVSGDKLLSPLRYLEMLGRGAIPLALPQTNLGTYMYLNMVHDLCNHAPLQILLPPKLLDFVSARTRLLLEVRAYILEKIKNYKRQDVFKRFMNEMLDHAARFFDAMHGTLNDNFDEGTVPYTVISDFMRGFRLDEETDKPFHLDLRQGFEIYIEELVNSLQERFIEEETEVDWETFTHFQRLVEDALVDVLSRTKEDLSLSYSNRQFRRDIRNQRKNIFIELNNPIKTEEELIQDLHRPRGTRYIVPFCEAFIVTPLLYFVLLLAVRK